RDLAAYLARYPWLARQVLGRVFGLSLDETPGSLARAAAFFRGVAFRPADETSAKALTPDPSPIAMGAGRRTRRRA
ncbi:MAG TPA: hypothetical protein VFI22_15315, partial [Thermomicrobiales bacterium]|nr:hypothetical protein [Thermomicrobiales bacterium]